MKPWITKEDWQKVRRKDVEVAFFAQPFGWAVDRGFFAAGFSLLAIYGFFEIREGREFLCYIGKTICFPDRLQTHRYPWPLGGNWEPGDKTRVLPFPKWPLPQGRTLEGFLDLVEIYLIHKYNPPRNTHHRNGPEHREYCIIGRPTKETQEPRFKIAGRLLKCAYKRS